MAEVDYGADDVRRLAREALVDLLIGKIRRDIFPSPTMLDMVESQITVEQLPEYLDLLIRRIDDASYPSMDMIKRVITLTR
jgi:hypothetical protein